jgi:hypothetical protein
MRPDFPGHYDVLMSPHARQLHKNVKFHWHARIPPRVPNWNFVRVYGPAPATGFLVICRSFVMQLVGDDASCSRGDLGYVY